MSLLFIVVVVFDDKGNWVNEVEVVKIRFKIFFLKIVVIDLIIFMDVVEIKLFIIFCFCVKIVKIRW